MKNKNKTNWKDIFHLKKEKDELDLELDKTSLEDIRKKIKQDREYGERGRELIKKRKEKNFQEIVYESFEDILTFAPAIVLLVIVLLGAIPSYYNVNDELLNPTNNSLSLNVSMNILSYVTYGLVIRAHNYGVEKPLLFIFLFWFTIFLGIIIPIIKVIIALVKRIKQKKR